MPLAIISAPDEGRIQGHGDRRRWRVGNAARTALNILQNA
jgi:hypothetical protein